MDRTHEGEEKRSRGPSIPREQGGPEFVGE